MVASNFVALIFTALAHLGAGLGCSYDEIAATRDPAIVSSYDPTLMKGFWYEQAFHDLAQVGASCQTLNATYDPQTGNLQMPFAVKYGSLPFTILENYEVHDPAMKGVYRKSVQAPFGIPGGHLIGLPTAVVAAELSSDKSRYEHAILYSCVSVLNVQELNIVSRNLTITDAKFQALLEIAKARGMPTGGLKRIDQTPCDHAASSDIPIVV